MLMPLSTDHGFSVKSSAPMLRRAYGMSGKAGKSVFEPL